VARSAAFLYYFDGITPLAERVIKLLCRRGNRGIQAIRVQHHIRHARDRNGISAEMEIYRRGRRFTGCILQDVHSDPFVKRMSTLWPIEKVVLFIDKLTERALHQQIKYVAMAEWIARTQFSSQGDALLILRRRPFYRVVDAYSRSCGISVSWYTVPPLLTSSSIHLLKRALYPLFGVVRRTLRRARSTEASGDRKAVDSSLTAIRFHNRELSLDPAARSDFFWLPFSEIEPHQVLLYFYGEMHVDPGAIQSLRDSGVRVLSIGGGNGGAPKWHAGKIFRSEVMRLSKRIACAFIGVLTTGRLPRFFYVCAMLRLAFSYAYWFDFFKSNRVNLHVSPVYGPPEDVGMVLALEDLGGFSTAYQYSLSDLVFPSSMLSSGENTQFVFSPAYERLYRSVYPSGSYVQTGYIHDTSMSKAVGRDRGHRLREALSARGAEFIISFFDENSVDRWDAGFPHSDTIEDYEYLLKWVLSDSTMGLIVKPKRPSTLFDRIKPLKLLTEEALKSGRCVFVGNGKETHISPGQAALDSDFAIGKLIGATAALEAAILGVPALLIDIEALYAHPFYSWGKGKVIFEDWPSLRTAVQKYRESPSSLPGLGCWRPGIRDLDPYLDNLAAVRIGSYLGSIQVSLRQGHSREDAIQLAGAGLENCRGSSKVYEA